MKINRSHVLAFILGLTGILGPLVTQLLTAQTVTAATVISLVPGTAGLVWALFLHTIAPNSAAAKASATLPLTILSTLAFITLMSSIMACALFTKVEPTLKTLQICVEDDAAKGMPLADIIDDCDKDVPAVIAAILNSDKTQVRTSSAYVEASRTRAMFTPAPVTTTIPIPVGR
jgi:hypothetical protein